MGDQRTPGGLADRLHRSRPARVEGTVGKAPRLPGRAVRLSDRLNRWGATDGFRTGWLTCDQLDECLDRIRQGRDRHLGVEFDRRGRPQKRLNVSYVRADLVLLLIGPSVGVVEAGLNALEQDWQQCNEKHDMTES